MYNDCVVIHNGANSWNIDVKEEKVACRIFSPFSNNRYTLVISYIPDNMRPDVHNSKALTNV